MDSNNIPLPLLALFLPLAVVSAPSELGISGFPVHYLKFLPAVCLNSARCDRDLPWLAPAMERMARTAGRDWTATSPAIWFRY
ncbi:hypothetical protein NL676_013947 [Syzygium grande]|nr:hypothetical protein NL676_013947 [Syzygium grande]